jgi:hypothetical protein
MACTLSGKKTDKLLSPFEMNGGDVGVIVKHPSPDYKGNIVMRGDRNILICLDNGVCWSDLVNYDDAEIFGIRLLTKDEYVKVYNT